MRSHLINRIRGYVAVEVRGPEAETFLNRAVEQKMSIWNVRKTGKNTLILYIALSDFFRLRPLLKQTGSRIHVLRRYGLPFWLDKLEQRKFFSVGVALFVVGLYMLSSLVWQIRVEGNEAIATQDVLEAARKQGIYVLQWKQRLPDPDRLSKQMQSLLPGAAWIGVELQGSKILIRVVESTLPEKKPLVSPRHLVAAKTAEVTEIFAEKGKALVKPHAIVKKGDILISGVIGDENNRQIVVAQGKVKGIVWEKVTVDIPLTQKVKVYTGESKKRSYLVIGNRALQVSGYGDIPFNVYEAKQDLKSLHWRDVPLPLGWMKETLLDVRLQEQSYTAEEARAIALAQAKADVLAAAGTEARIIGSKWLAEQTDNGHLRLEALMEVEQNIAVEQPIVGN